MKRNAPRDKGFVLTMGTIIGATGLSMAMMAIVHSGARISKRRPMTQSERDQEREEKRVAELHEMQRNAKTRAERREAARLLRMHLTP